MAQLTAKGLTNMTDDTKDVLPRDEQPAGDPTDKSDFQSIKESQGGQLQELITYLAKAIVDNPDSVDVRELEGGHSTLIELRVKQSDVGMVIGKRGRTAVALRTILSAVAAKLRKKAVLEIIG